ncbi:MAG: hypothetical protein WCX64_05965 [Candidatus Micrarchaeia archaeon]|jgi:hypothetical protein
MSEAILAIIIGAVIVHLVVSPILEAVLVPAIQNSTGLEKYPLIGIEIILGIPTDLYKIVLKVMFWLFTLVTAADR